MLIELQKENLHLISQHQISIGYYYHYQTDTVHELSSENKSLTPIFWPVVQFGTQMMYVHKDHVKIL